MNPDCRDIRFSDSAGNELSFWISITEGMVRKLHSLPVWVTIPSLPAGDSSVFLHFDKGEESAECGSCGVPASPNCGNGCGDNTFDIYSLDLGDGSDWKCDAGRYKDPNAKFVSEELLSNTFILNFRVQCVAEKEMVVYFLTQENSSAGNIDMYDGYKMFVDWDGIDSDDEHYNRGKWFIRLFKKEGGGSWDSEIDSVEWLASHNSVQDFEIRVGENNGTIEISINGISYATVPRDDCFSGGYVGFDRVNWSTSGEEGSNSTDGISPLFVRRYIHRDPEVAFAGRTDLAIRKVQPTFDRNFMGEGIVENLPRQQRLVESILGNTLESYIFNAYDIAQSDQIFIFRMKVKNRGEGSDTIDILVNKEALVPSEWLMAYSYDSFSQVPNLPGGDNQSGQITLAAGGEEEIECFIMPSSRVLAEEGLGALNVVIRATSQEDLSCDTGQFIAKIVGNPECYWVKKMPVTISYPDDSGTGDLYDYQILVNVSGMDFSDAHSDGSDIFFTDADKVTIPFWQKSFNKKGGEGAFWVKVPSIISGGSTSITMWWGNTSGSSRSSKVATFDLWHDSTGRLVDEVVGCSDGTHDCSSLSEDPDGWKNNPTFMDNYNWWKIKEKDGNAVIMADKGAFHNSSDIGPLLTNGDVNWNNYEVTYAFHDEYTNYDGAPYGNPQHNPIYFQDRGNQWGMEFCANTFIFRPFVRGTDYRGIFQVHAGNILGQAFPLQENWYFIKVRAFNNPSTNQIHLSLLSTTAGKIPHDRDDDDGYVTIGNFLVDQFYSLEGGKIGFGGWNGGFSFDDIRVRKYVEPEPSSKVGLMEDGGYSSVASFSFPKIVPCGINGRSIYLNTIVHPWKWRGDLYALFADCLINNCCQSGEDKNLPGTVSLWGSIDSATPKGFGTHLMETFAGDDNRGSIHDSDWKASGRYIFTSIDEDGDSTIEKNETIPFGIKQKERLRDLLGTEDNSETERLIRFVRGSWISGYPRSDTRDMNTDNDATTHNDNEQWKLSDVIHSSPLFVGLPAMGIFNDTYKDFVTAFSNRDRVLYFSSNDGMVHAVRLALYDEGTKKFIVDTNGTELWCFIPHTILNKLKDTTENYHKYTVDGLLRAVDAKLSDGAYHTILCGVLRSGGVSVFALDVTHPTAPVFLWEINGECGHDLDQDGDVDSTDATIATQIGETWSAPAMGRLKGQEKEVAIFGSGFAVNDIAHLKKKAFLTVVDLETGKVLHQVKLSDKVGNVVFHITPLRDRFGYIKRIYMSDLYGRVFRFDLDDENKVTSFFSKNSADSRDILFEPIDYPSSDITNTLNFPQRPVTVPITTAYGGKPGEYWVYFGTGLFDGYHDAYPYQRFYGIRDIVQEFTLTDSDLVNRTCTCTCSGGNGEKLPDFCAPRCETVTHGWYIELGHNDPRDVEGEKNQISKDRNERVLNFAKVYGGYVFFTTYTPIDSPCKGGIAQLYVVKYDTGKVTEDPILDINGDKHITSEDTITLDDIATPARSLKLGDGIPSAPHFIVSDGVVKTVVGLNPSPNPAEVTLNSELLTQNAHIILWREVK
ncbi:MAG: PilC/PilY family type IV pilus protein [Thermodesulfobacteriota bacterium]|nr:PilC/PilY family type IV pilus protein [Thermodesulfobacteriota bacterium]